MAWQADVSDQWLEGNVISAIRIFYPHEIQQKSSLAATGRFQIYSWILKIVHICLYSLSLLSLTEKKQHFHSFKDALRPPCVTDSFLPLYITIKNKVPSHQVAHGIR